MTQRIRRLTWHGRGHVVGLLLLALSSSHCQSADDNRETGGETHFLTCSKDADCRSLSDAHVCQNNVCRLPEPPLLRDSGTSSVAEVTDAASIACAEGEIGASEVVVLGDSFFAITHEITAQLELLASEAGVQTADEHYRDHSRLVGNALALASNGIADQYANAVAEGQVRVVIMNGGGADALGGSCETVDADCPLITAAASAAADLLAQMAADGVLDVVYAFYPDAVDPDPREKVDVMRPLIRDICAAALTRCHWLDLRTTFEGRYDEFIEADGLNPTTAGSEAVAREIWDVMQRNCIAQ